MLIHIITEKGRGYIPAETASDKMHGVGKYDIKTGKQMKPSTKARSACYLLHCFHPVRALSDDGRKQGAGCGERQVQHLEWQGDAAEHAGVLGKCLRMTQ